MLYARFPRCSLYTILDVRVLLKSGHNVHRSIAHFIVGEYGLKNRNLEYSKLSIFGLFIFQDIIAHSAYSAAVLLQ